MPQEQVQRDTTPQAGGSQDGPERRGPASGSTAALRHPHTYVRPRVSLLYVVRRTLHRLLEIQVWDVAAAMTFFGAVALLPFGVALLSLVSLLGVEEETVRTTAELAAEVWPALPPETVREWILSLRSADTSGVAFVLGLLGALFSASGAVSAFHRAMHRIHDTREGRTLLHFRLVVFLETLVLMVGLVILVGLVIVGGDVAQRAGQLIGLPREAVQTWELAKWPVILALLSLAVTLAYRLGPNVRPPRYRPFSAGAVLAVGLLFAAALALGWITSTFGQFEVVGRINSVIGVLGLVWAACMVLVAGAAYDAERLRGRQLAVGVDASVEIQLAPRDVGVLEAVERLEHRDQLLGSLVYEAARSGEPLTVERTPLLSEAGRPFAVDSPRRGPRDLSSGTPFHARPPTVTGHLGDGEPPPRAAA